jgi:hypothetical protein
MAITCRLKRDRTIQLFSASLLIFALSFVLPLFSTDRYCHNLRLAHVFGIASMVILLGFLFWNRATSTRKKIASGVGEAICILAILLNLGAIVAAGDLCRGIN